MTKSKIQNKPKIQMTKSKTSVLSFAICALCLLSQLCFGICHLYAQEDNKVVSLTKQIIEAKTPQDFYPLFEQLKDLYFEDNKYKDFVEFLRSLNKERKALEPFTNYYIALCRYQQLKYLEETQNWDEYFGQGNTYREEIAESAQKTLDATTSKDPLNLYARLILWQFHKDQRDIFSDSALTDLMNSVLEYSKDAKNLSPIKDAAERLMAYDEKGKSKELYKIYVDKLTTSGIKDEELGNIASDFYKEGNLELSQAIYNVYTEKIAKYPKENLIPILIDIAKKFSYKDEGPKDALYAEEVFKKIEDVGTEDTFDEGLIYLRSFNLEKAKEYNKAKDLYINLINRFPQSIYTDEANFKIGIIHTYILYDIEAGTGYFEKLTQKERITPRVISGFYQLGLLSQWKQDLERAKEYYNKLIEKAGGDFIETVTLAKERLKEIGEAKPLEYNLKIFLDASLKEEYKIFDMTKLDLRASGYRINKDKEINIISTPYLAESGCMQVELQYLWSGNLGTAKPSPEQPSFNTSYIDPGTKVINLVVVSPSGIIDRNIELVDVY